MDLKDKIKICLIMSFTEKVTFKDKSFGYKPKEEIKIIECVINNDVAIDIETGRVYDILKLDKDKLLYGEINLNYEYVYEQYDYKILYFKDVFIHSPKYDINEAITLANKVYNNSNKIITFDKFLIKKNNKKR
ncbi:MAG: hypothetical protein PHN42_00920 [Bacilli bacterium]|nr:hypothetical protein [Bacilli bacterium]